MNQHLQKLQAEIQELKIKLTALSATNDCGNQTEPFVKDLAIQYQDTLSKTNSIQNMECNTEWLLLLAQVFLLQTMKTTFSSSKDTVADHEDNLSVLKEHCCGSWRQPFRSQRTTQLEAARNTKSIETINAEIFDVNGMTSKRYPKKNHLTFRSKLSLDDLEKIKMIKGNRILIEKYQAYHTPVIKTDTRKNSWKHPQGKNKSNRAKIKERSQAQLLWICSRLLNFAQQE